MERFFSSLLSAAIVVIGLFVLCVSMIAFSEWISPFGVATSFFRPSFFRSYLILLTILTLLFYFGEPEFTE